jgi:predicted aspartyl protease
MGTFKTDCSIENILNRTKSFVMPQSLVDTGSELTWAPGSMLEHIGIRREPRSLTFVMPNGQHVTRSVGFAIVRVGQEYTVDQVVFAEPSDMNLLGARTLEGLNLMVDPTRRRLVASGPIPAAHTPRPKRRPRVRKKRKN